MDDLNKIEMTATQISIFNNVDKTKPSKMVNSLVLIVFPVETLEESSVSDKLWHSITAAKSDKDNAHEQTQKRE